MIQFNRAFDVCYLVVEAMMKIGRIGACCAGLAFAGGVADATAANLFPNAGFETWDSASGMPTAEKGRWRLSATGKNGFTVLERSTKGKGTPFANAIIWCLLTFAQDFDLAYGACPRFIQDFILV